LGVFALCGVAGLPLVARRLFIAPTVDQEGHRTRSKGHAESGLSVFA
jgi:hypothetical protein